MIDAIVFLFREFISWITRRNLYYERYKPRMYGDRGRYDEEDSIL